MVERLEELRSKNKYAILVYDQICIRNFRELFFDYLLVLKPLKEHISDERPNNKPKF